MIPYRREPDVNIAPRVRGMARAWMPRPAIPISLTVGKVRVGRARRRHLDMLLLGIPTLGDSAGLELGAARAYPIGWFDLESVWDAVPAFREADMETEEGNRVGTTRPLSPEEEFLRRLAARLQPPLARLTAPNGVLEWRTPLLPYQQEGVGALLSRPSLLLADDMGLGKSIQTIAALRILFFQQRIDSALIVCPASLLTQWRRELQRWASDLRVATITGSPHERSGLWRMATHVRLVSYETLRMDVVEIADSPVAREVWDVVVLDEASRIKNRASGNSIACKRLHALRRWALTGTPLENSIDDVASILEFLEMRAEQHRDGKKVAPCTISSSPSAYALDNSASCVSHTPSAPASATSSASVFHTPSAPASNTPSACGGKGGRGETVSIVTRLRALQLRRKKQDVLQDLPPRLIQERILELSPLQRTAYDRAEKEGILRLAQYGSDLSITHVLELIIRLKQLCNVDPASGESAKFRDIALRMETLSLEGHRALIFSQFTDDTFGIGKLAHVLRTYRPLEYTGNLSPARRTAVVERFMTDPTHKALLLSLRAGGMGLNLQAASYVFHLDRWWNPAIEEQADSRAHRMGQPYHVTVVRYICADTIEERIDATLKNKRKLFTDLIDDVTLDLTATLSAEELFQLFGLTR